VQCKVCRSNVEEGQSVCPYCGSVVTADSQPTPERIIKIVPGPNPRPHTKTKNATAAKTKKSKMGFIVALVAVALVGVLIGSVLIRYLKPAQVSPMPDGAGEQSPAAVPQTTVLMPECVGKTEEQVKALFEKMPCGLAIEYVYDDEVMPGYVVSQSVPSHTEVGAGMTVTVQISQKSKECPTPYTQKLTLEAAGGMTTGTLALHDWEDGEWVKKFSCEAVIGRNGISANYGEGKGYTPQGTFRLGVALARDRSIAGDWPVRIVTYNTCVVDDADSYYYNIICETNDLPGGTHYDAVGKTILNGVVDMMLYIEHNGDGFNQLDVVPGKGSVITICAKSTARKPTAGCVDITTSDMVRLMDLLDADKDPHIEIEKK